MNAISITYIAFFLLGIAAFYGLRPQKAVAIVYVSGLLFLPVSYYPSLPIEIANAEMLSSYQIMTSALPADSLINKALIAAITALVGAMIFDYRKLATFRPTVIDLPMVAWCLWPLIQSFFRHVSPAGWISSLYILAIWGLPWLLGRIYFHDRAGRLQLADIVIGATLFLLPIAIFEGISGQRVYEWFFGVHPFANVGAERYFGYRPLAMFEDGNQYGLWVCCTALLAVWRFKTLPSDHNRKLHCIAAVILCMMAIAAQSIGALLLMFIGMTVVLFDRLLRYSIRAAVPAMILISLALAVYGSGVIPLRSIAKETVVGQVALDVLRTTGRSSFSWRISQDQQTIPQIQENLITGSGQWDWWRELGRRPWGLWLLLVGQFGLIGLMLALGSPIAAMLSRLRNSQSIQAKTIELDETRDDPSSALVLAMVVVIMLIDALLNAFIFFPAVMFAGSLLYRSDGRKEPNPKALQQLS
ncbi:hypothetical protein [Parasphingorhabdus cellanae]|uniref:O-antigen ligase domain-containing protein n=1 Tax=Parasphingorhabdus cellanae TaxID=2806553 RepID=A0ABX7T3T9_9SPHN|nr:hypothetical protein [Parasphingorhabdus cellanae]QTD56241.1 hypothetical protein J4G78_01140 [Parasphingorhabdus cellanae]